MKLLLSADLHLGRKSSRVGERSSHTAIACWDRMVTYAIEQSVDAVLLAGDVVEQRNKRFESYGPLHAGISRLSAAGITTIAVSGNHDFDVLPQLVDSIGEDLFFLLGRNGWESRVFTLGDQRLQVDGWCFPDKRVPINPLDSYSTQDNDVDLHLGMVHGDLDATNSKYAPLTAESLSKTKVAGWLLGHIHKPELRNTAQPWTLYPGSPQALDPGEAGIHGVWLLDSALDSEPQLIPFSSICYSSFEIDITSCDDDESIAGYVERELKQHGVEIADQFSSSLGIVSLRPTIIGDCEQPLVVVQDLKNLTDYQINDGGVSIEVEKVHWDVRENLRVEDYAGQKNALAKAVSLLHELETGEYSAGTLKLLAEFGSRCSKLSNHYGSLIPVEEELSEDAQREQLKRQLANMISTIREQANV